MSMFPDSSVSQIIDVARMLYDRRLIFACDGNISMRTADGTILMTPSGWHKGFLTPDLMAQATISGEVLKGNPSSELAMHLEVYRKCPEAKAVIHAHPPHAIAWSIARPDLKELPAECMSEVILAVGCIPIAPFALPGTPEMASHIRDLLPEHRVMVLARHGALSWGESLPEAFVGMERIEAAAEILYRAELLGGANPLAPEIVQHLKDKRQQLLPYSF